MPLVIIKVIPETIESVPSVTISEGTRNSAEHSPLNRPIAAALPRLTRIPTAMATPGSTPKVSVALDMTFAAITLVRAAVAPTERSMPPTIMTSI